MARDLEVRVKYLLGNRSDAQKAHVKEKILGLGLCDLGRGQS